MTTLAIEEEKNWLEKVLSSLTVRGKDSEVRGEDSASGSVEEMIDEAARKAFRISTALGLIPGPLGMATILPEVAALTRLQVNLIRKIASHHGKEHKVNKELVLLILANVDGGDGRRDAVEKGGNFTRDKIGQYENHEDGCEEGRHQDGGYGGRKSDRTVDTGCYCSSLWLLLTLSHEEDRKRGSKALSPGDRDRDGRRGCVRKGICASLMLILFCTLPLPCAASVFASTIDRKELVRLINGYREDKGWSPSRETGDSRRAVQQSQGDGIAQVLRP